MVWAGPGPYNPLAMQFISTRGQAPHTSFADVLLAGLAPDGGLYLPANWPQFSAGEIPKLDAGKQYMTRYEITDFVDRKKPGQAVIEAFFTAKGSAVYAIFPEAPRGDWVLQDLTPAAATRVTALGTQAPLKWEKAGSGIRIHFPVAGGPVAVRISGAR